MSHLFGDRERLESSLCHFTAFVGDAGLLAELVDGTFVAQLNADTG